MLLGVWARHAVNRAESANAAKNSKNSLKRESADDPRLVTSYRIGIDFRFDFCILFELHSYRISRLY